jgi:hypothetical protein
MLITLKGMNVYANLLDDIEICDTDITIGEVKKYKNKLYNTDKFEAEYVVINTEITGGGTGMGHYDVFPDGYKVVCKKLFKGQYYEKGEIISFYQSGCFTAVIRPEELQPIRNINFEGILKFYEYDIENEQYGGIALKLDDNHYIDIEDRIKLLNDEKIKLIIDSKGNVSLNLSLGKINDITIEEGKLIDY